MYDVTIQNGNVKRLIHDHRSASNSQKLESGSIVDAENSISSFTFTVYPNNAGFDELNAYTTLITVRNTKRSRNDFVGRVLQVNPEMDSSGMITKTVVCEDRLGFLHDSVQPYEETRHYVGDDTRTGLEEFIDVLLANHNAQVESYKRIYRGNVTVEPFESSNDVTKGLNWQSTFDAIKEKLLNSFGGFIRLRETAGVLYLDYLKSVGTTRSTTIEVGRNMRSASKEIDPSGIVTRVIPLGAKLVKNDGSGNETESEERLTIADVNGGLNYIESEAYAEQFGIKYGTVIFDDVTNASNLLRKGTDWLAANNGLVISHKVDALELSLLGLDIDDFVLYDRYPVRNPLIGTNDILQIIKKVTNVVEPHNSSFEMGSIMKRLSDMLIDEMLNIGAINGKNSYLHLMYSANEDGSGMTEQPTSTTKYIGTHTSMSPEAPTDPTAYKWSLIRGSDGKDGADGNNGADGKDGADGVGVKAITNYYLASASSSGVTTSTSGWTTAIQIVSSSKKYLWNYEVITFTDNSTSTTIPCIIGNYASDGANGTSGKDGEDGVGIASIQEYYARSASNSTAPTDWNTTVPTLTTTYRYLWNYEVITLTDSTTKETAKRVIGVYGDTGAAGAAGKDGVTYYTWIKYADSPTSGMSDNPDGKKYIGIAYNKTSLTESTSYSDYAWSLVKGEDGSDGVNGVNGEDGKTYYTWIKYADDAKGTNMTNDPTGKFYIGIAYNKETSTESNSASDYTWSLFRGADGVKGDKGDKGDQGIQGPAGEDGQTLYTWLKYADTPTSGMSNTPDGKTYIGLAYNKTSSTESSNYSDYTWSLIKGADGKDGADGAQGAQGPQGVPGPAGEDGQTLYTWIRYADDASGSGMSQYSDGKKYIGLAYNKTTATESNTASDYTWSLFRGSDGTDGKDGADGAKGDTGVGVERIVPRYAVGTSNTEAPSTPSIAEWSIAAPALSYGEYLWCAYYVQYTDGTSAWTEPFHARSADQITQADTEPENPTVGMIWLDTSETPYMLMRYNGTGWEVLSDYSSEFEEVYTHINTTVTDLKTTTDALIASVEEETVSKSVYEEFSSIVKNILNMESDGTTMIFQTINEAIQQVGDTEASHYAELLTYIRFNDDGIEIGKKDNAITMQLDNDSLDFYNNGTKVAYISDNQLYITDGRFLRSVRIGNYGFIPEANGSVSFTYLGGES